jgi:hypothetical protein
VAVVADEHVVVVGIEVPQRAVGTPMLFFLAGEPLAEDVLGGLVNLFRGRSPVVPRLDGVDPFSAKLAVCGFAVVSETRELVVVETAVVGPLLELGVLLFPPAPGEHSHRFARLGGRGDRAVGLAHGREGLDEHSVATAVGVGDRLGGPLPSLVDGQLVAGVLGGVSPVPPARRGREVPNCWRENRGVFGVLARAGAA